MIQHQFNKSFSQERRIVYVLVGIQLVVLIIAIGVITFSATSLSVITLVLALIEVASTALVILFIYRAYTSIPITKEKRRLLLTKKERQ